MALLKLIRWSNLLIIASCQLLIKYALIASFELSQNLNGTFIFLLVLSTVCIAAGGNIINDVQDVAIDAINKPKKIIVGRLISENDAHILYVIFTVIGVISGFLLCNLVGKPSFAVLFVALAGLLYIYATSLKRVFIVGNLTIAVLVALSLLIVPFFDFLPVNGEQIMAAQKQLFKLVFYYAVFAFALTLLRELVKDIIDVDGDHTNGVRSVPVVIGRERSGNIALAMGVLLLAAVLYYSYVFLLNEPIMLAYFFAALASPLLLFCIKAYQCQTKQHYLFLSLLLKIIMGLGIASMILYRFI